jgi:hypothetical protein
MEQGQSREGSGSGRDPWLDAYDAVPRDGPAVFVMDTASPAHEGPPRGRWLDPTQPADVLHRQIGEVVGDSSNGWAIIDQVGLGPIMVPEQLSLSALSRLARRWSGREARHRTTHL